PKMGTKHHSRDSVSGDKKRRRAEFPVTDAGIGASDCITIYLVFSKDELESGSSFILKPVDLNVFFEDDGKFYGYKDLKITVWLSGISFHAFADISFESSSDGGKGITDLKSALSSIFAENLVESKDEFLQTFSTDCDYVKSVVSDAEVLPRSKSTGCGFKSKFLSEELPSDVEVFRVGGSVVGQLYCRLVPLVLLLVDGSNPIDVTDPRWEIYLLVHKGEKGASFRLLGFAVAYRFYRYPCSSRLRLGQILIIPPYQRKGYGSHLIRLLNDVAIADDLYDFTIEEPTDSVQHVRTCIDVERLLTFPPVSEALGSAVSRLRTEENNTSKFGRPPSDVVEKVREKLKITKRQLLQCWEILLYLSLDRNSEPCVEKYWRMVRGRVRGDVMGKDSKG
ncbi:hypothetical protein M569_11455, partial [Genlisea aurea]